MSGYENINYERCRYCNLDLPQDNLSAMNHYNSHWRQSTPQTFPHFGQYAFDSHPVNRVSQVSINSEDLEVSGHLSQSMNFHYNYSPQPEPISRCSPLNLTGKSKVDSPLASPLSSPLPSSDVQPNMSGHTFNMNHNQIQNLEMHPDMNNSQQYSSFSSFSNELFNMSNQLVSSIPMNHSPLNSSGEETLELNSCEMDKRERKYDREFRCEICNRLYYSKVSFDEHFNICHSKNVIANINDESHNNGFVMENNVTIGQVQEQTILQDEICIEKPYKCSICDQEFSFKEELNQHANYHEALKPYRCNICGVGLSHLSALRRHVMSHSGKKPHVCEICNKGFFQKCDLVRHYSTHGKRKEMECSQCKRKFNSDHYLKNHKCKKSHQDDKPFKCNICGNNCATNVAWSYHMWKHTKNPIFVPFQTNRGGNQILNVNLAAKDVLLPKDV